MFYDSVEFVSQNFNSSYFSLFHLNISSLSKHFNDLTYLLSDLNFNFSAIGITETGLQSKSPSLNCNLNGYTFIHTPSESIKGGALLYISDKLSCSSRPDLDQLCYISHQLESVFVEVIHPKGKNYIIGCIYKHPHMDLHDFNMNHLTPILSKTTSENKNIFLMGDFNANLLLSDSNPDISDFLDSIFSFSLAPSILLPTRITENTSTLIDNIFHDPFELNCKSGNIISSISDHFPQFLIINKQHVLPPPPTKRSPIPDWNKFNQELFSQKISAIDWNELLCLNELDPSKSFDIFHTFVNNYINECVPLKKSFTRNNTNSHKEWITTGILTSIRKRDALHKQFIKEKDPFIKSLLHTSFKKYRNKLVTLCRISKSNFYKQFFIKNKNNSKAIWDGVRSIISLRSAKSPTPSCLNINNNLTTDPLTISNSFNSCFSSIADNLRKSIPPSFKHFSSYLKNPTANSIFFRPTNDLEVLDFPIAKLINLSFSTGIYPSSLKIAKVIPVYKKGSNVELCNYRPISLLSNIDKIFEKLIFNRLYNFFSMNNTIFPDQFGFRKKFSTSHALLNITQKIMEAIDNGLLVCGVFIDLQKAFDTVDHEILIKKLYHYGIRGVPLSLLRSFLTNREQFVFINNSSSSHKPIRHGVPQGSVLGPLLFLLYINDLHTAIKHSMVHLFADDTNLLNISNDTVKYLGITLDSNLSWKSQINITISNLKKSNGALAKARHFVPKCVLRQIYFAIFYSQIQYCSLVWGQKSSLTRRIEILQNHAIRIISFSTFNASPTPLYGNLNLIKFSDMICIHNIIFLLNLYYKTLPISLINTFAIDFAHSHHTRAADKGFLNLPLVHSTAFVTLLTHIKSNYNFILFHPVQIPFSCLKVADRETIMMIMFIAMYHPRQITSIIAHMKRRKKAGKAAGPSGVVVIMVRADYNEWNESYIINLYKGEGDALDRGNFRGLKLTD
ncbi:uncharacterized protein LOC130613625 [Hydractinia symbiolongicarpus]|uniref:uncharacterized protein LOC130613625 n=1 Tax=Hydractinia symbiolongicarpus TaxID=13093 RepID=UPI00254BD706|nr:uncharacterized protein LOC130613625 [Hydractinia symbiolongicarpus]